MKTPDVFSKAFDGQAAKVINRTSAPKPVRGLNDPQREHPYVFQVIATTVVDTEEGKKRTSLTRTVTCFFVANSEKWEIEIGISDPESKDGGVEFGALSPVMHLQKGWIKERMSIKKSADLIVEANEMSLADHSLHFSYMMDIESGSVSAPAKVAIGEDWTMLQAIESILNKYIAREVNGFYGRRAKDEKAKKSTPETVEA